MHRPALLAILALVTSAALLAGEPPAKPARQVRSFASKFGTVYVVDEGDVRSLRFGDPDAADQTVINVKDPDQVPLEYARTAALGFSFPSAPKRALMIGLGGGAFLRIVRRWFAEVETDAVEIDPVVVEVAKEYFHVVEDARSRLFTDDGARFLKRETGPWDLIFLDAYDGDDVPVHLATRAFFELVRTRLAPSGVVVMNLAVDDKALERDIRDRFSSVFVGCTAVPEPEWGNVLLFGTPARQPGHGREALRERAEKLARAKGIPFAFGDAAKAAGECRARAARR